jgi:pimeloyl-ACP methyl ester carboxylesterase
MCPSGRERIRAYFEEFVAAFDMTDRLGAIPIPVLVVAHRQDRLIPVAACESLRDGLHRAEYVVLEHTGHDYPKPGSADDELRRATIRRFHAGLSAPVM